MTLASPGLTIVRPYVSSAIRGHSDSKIQKEFHVPRNTAWNGKLSIMATSEKFEHFFDSCENEILEDLSRRAPSTIKIESREYVFTKK